MLRALFYSGRVRRTNTSPASRVYLDHAATAPVRPEVAEQVAADLRGRLGGLSLIHI